MTKIDGSNIALNHITIIWIYKKTRRPFRRYEVGTMLLSSNKFYIWEYVLLLKLSIWVYKKEDTLFQKSRDWYHIVAI